MKRFFRNFYWIVTIPLAVVVVVFALANRELVVIDIWPLPLSLEQPLFLFILGSFLVGFLVGTVTMWISAGRYRRRARVARNRVAQLEHDVRLLQHEKARAAARATEAAAGGSQGNVIARQQGSTSLPAA